MSSYENQWREAIKKSELNEKIDRIVPIKGGLKIIYHKVISETPLRHKEFEMFVNTHVPYNQESLDRLIKSTKNAMDNHVIKEKAE